MSTTNPKDITAPNNFLSLRIALLLMAFNVFVGISGFMWIESYSLREAFYMTIITISTVGYAEVQPLDANGQLFVSLLIIFNIAVYAYLISAFTNFIITGKVFTNMKEKTIAKKIQKLQDHVILCGYGKHGREVAHNLINHKIPLVVIEKEETKTDDLIIDKNHLFIVDDATHDDALIRAGVTRAKAIITALPDDTENLFTVLSARQLSKNIKIISRAFDPRSEKKLKMAGANHVIMPEQIGGYYMATLVNKPGAIDFFSFITNEYASDIGFEVITYDDMPESCKDKRILDLHIRKHTGTNIIGYKDINGKYIVNPGPETVIDKGCSLIVLGSEQQLVDLKEYLGTLDS